MARYAFHDLTLEVGHVQEESRRDLDQVLDELFWVETRGIPGIPSLSLSVRLSDDGVNLPSNAREVLSADGFRGLESERDFYLTDGASVFYLQPWKGRGEAHLAPSFLRKPRPLREKFWAFGLLKLLRPMGIYPLHAAGLIAENGMGLLVVGESGSGKSTLTIALIRRGWRYLSDEAVLLRSRPDGVEALAMRRHFYVVGAEAEDYADLLLGEERPDRYGGRRRRVCIETAYPAQRVGVCTPRVLLFSRVAGKEQSVLLPLDRADALGQLISQSSPQLFDRETMAPHLATLSLLLQQAEAYELHAGTDLRDDPNALACLLAAARGERPCLVSS